jgi:hypothetical protein
VPLFVGYTTAVIVEGPVVASAPLNSILGSALVDPIFGVIRIFLSEFAIPYIPFVKYLLDIKVSNIF